MLIKVDQDILLALTNTEKQVLTFINSHSEKIPNMSIQDIADATFSSPATVSRTIKKCGIDGFTELRYILSKQTENKTTKDSTKVNDILKKSLLEVTNTLDNISIDNVLKAVDIIKTAPRIYLLSRGLTELVSQEFSLKMQLLGYDIFMISDPAIMQKVTADIKSSAIVIILTLSGTTQELIVSAENAAAQGAKIITICCNSEAPLVKLATIPLLGYKYPATSIKNVDATSRFPLYIISRILIDYLTQDKKA